MKKEVKVGLFAILMLLIGWGVIRVLKGADLFGNTNTYYAYYEQVGGLQEASQVMLYGVKIGSVTKVTLSEDPTKGVELTMEIEKRYQLPVDSKAKIFNNGLMGGKAVEIIYGQSSEMLSDEGVLQPEVTVDLMEMASSEMEGLITKVTTIMDNLTQTLEGINGLMAQNTQSITNIVSNVDGVTGNVNAMLAKERTHLEEALESLSKFSKSLGENTDEIDAIVRSEEEPTFENTIEAMKHCLDMGVNTLEMDFVLSGDGKVVVSHESYFHHRYTTRPDGSLVQKADPKEYLYKMTYDQIAKYDVGVRANDTYPDKACVPAVKPLAEDLITFVENYTKENGLSPVRYNIEIKSREADGEGINWPIYHDLVDACAKVLLSRHLDDRLVVQCFDVRALNFMHEKYPEFKLSYLTGAKDKDFDKFMAKLKFVPEWLSPHYTVVDEALVQKCREKGMKIVPWTVDQPEDLQRMIDLGVDAIITNYPDRLLKLTRGYAYPAPGPFPHR